MWERSIRLPGIEIVRAVIRKDRKVILVNSEINKFNKIASVVIPASSEKAIEDLVSALSSGKGGSEVLKAAELLKAAKSVAIIVPARVTDKEFVKIKELSGQLKNVTYYPLVRRSNFQGALDMGMHPAYFPGYQRVGGPAAAVFARAWERDPVRNAWHERRRDDRSHLRRASSRRFISWAMIRWGATGASSSRSTNSNFWLCRISS